MKTNITEKICKGITDIFYGETIDNSVRQTVENNAQFCNELGKVMTNGINEGFAKASKKIEAEFAQYDFHCPKEFRKK